MTTNLNGKVAIVTGGGQGIGAAIAHRLASEGAAVTVADINTETAERTAADISTRGGKALAVECNVTSNDNVVATVEQTIAKFGSLEILVSNAGLTRDNLLHKMSDEDWDLVIDTHLKGSFFFARAVQQEMVRQQYGKIVFISSRSALGNRGQTNYSTAKAGLQGMTRTLAIELGPFGVNVNAVAPGHIDTEMTRAVARRVGIEYDDLVQSSIDANAIKRVGVPDDIADAVNFFASEESSYVTGQILYVAGRPTV